MNKLAALLTASVITSALSVPANAYLITQTRTDRALGSGFSIDAKTFGYDPAIDFVTSVRLFVRFSEIDDDSAIDMPGSETSEFITVSPILFGVRIDYYPDIDTNDTLEYATIFTPGQDTCVWLGEDGCDYDPIKSGIFSMGIQAENLLVAEERWDLEVTRTEVDEPPASLLLVPGLFFLWLTRRQRRQTQPLAG